MDRKCDDKCVTCTCVQIDGKFVPYEASNEILDTLEQINNHNGSKDYTITEIALNTIPATEHHITQQSNGGMLATRYAKKMTIKDM